MQHVAHRVDLPKVPPAYGVGSLCSEATVQQEPFDFTAPEDEDRERAGCCCCDGPAGGSWRVPSGSAATV